MSSGLASGDRVCIIGGGPAGSFAALHLLRQMKERNLALEVLIFEPRDFSRPGPGGCNKCAGVLSTRLLHGLCLLELCLPDDIIQSHVRAYGIRLDGEHLRIEQPDPSRQIVSVYRGGGPRMLSGEPVASFDQVLLRQACMRGARHIPSRVRRVTREDRPVVHTARESFPADLIILATGVNSRSPLDDSFGYQPPQTAVMAQDEFLLPEGWPENEVRAYFGRPAGLLFGALIPKGRYLNISLLGQDLSTDAVSDFIEAQSLTAELPSSPGSLCGCTPRIAVSASGKFVGTRWVAVGDAAVSRLYKDGIGSAFFSAQRAIEVVLQEGLSGNALRRHYAPYCRQIARDNRYGRFLFQIWSLANRSRLLRRMWKHAIQFEADWPPERRVHIRILWSMLSGDDAYEDLFKLLLSPAAMVGLWRGLRGAKTGKTEV